MAHAEIIAAEHAEYGDCARFQILCPCCREAVFKGERTRPKTAHYFSHYRALSKDVRGCELRAEAIAHAHAPIFTVETHGQTLAHFSQVLREEIIKSHDHLIPSDLFRQSAFRIMGRPDFPTYAAAMREILNGRPMQRIGMSDEQQATNQVGRLAADFLSNYTPFKTKSPFWCRRQASFVFDMIGHLRSGQSPRNVGFLAAAALVIIADRPAYYPSAHLSPQSIAAVQALVTGKPPALVRKLWMSSERPEPSVKYIPSADNESERIRSLFGFGSTPSSKDALMSGAGGSVFRDASKVPKEIAIKAISDALGEANSDIDKATSKIAETKDRLMQLRIMLAICQAPYGILAAVPFHELAMSKVMLP